MSTNTGEIMCSHCCEKQLTYCRHSFTRQRWTQLCCFFMGATTIMLYVSLLPGLFSKAMYNAVAPLQSNTSSTYQALYLESKRITLVERPVNDIVVAKPVITLPETPPPTARGLSSSSQRLSTTTTLSSSSLLLSLITKSSSPTTVTASSLRNTPVALSMHTPYFRPNSFPISSFPLPSTTTEKFSVDRYVTFGGGFADGRGLGNQMFNLAVVVYVAHLTGRQPGILKFNYKIALDEVFDLGIQRFDNLFPCYMFGEDGSLWYDRHIEDLQVNGSRAPYLHGKSIFLSGFFQSWKYTRNVEHRIRQHFTLLPEMRQFVDKFMAESRPPGWLDDYVRVAVHVRRGDVLNPDKIKFGYTTPNELYFARAMRYFVDRFDRIQFIVSSNDIGWCVNKFAEFATALRHRVNITYVPTHSRGRDFAILASCKHAIMSTGTYGWWAAWLTGGITIYYSDWPSPGSRLARKFRRDDFFPPTWIGMT